MSSLDPNEGSDGIRRNLKRFLDNTNADATYTCGGTITLPSLNAPEVLTPAPNASFGHLHRPVTIRWDKDARKRHSSVSNKLLLPTLSTDGQDPLLELLEDSQPATFGYRGQDILDEKYRMAHKMEVSQFCTDFNPYEVGICHAIAQTLMPDSPKTVGSGPIHVELYKLNIYSGPRGKFHAHVDTPRSPTQFGSLVVCLPYPHSGGELRVRHAGSSTEFNWSQSYDMDDPKIHWAAFYSDCEHEVAQVTEGHRVTLTYNLYFSSTNSILAHPPTLDPKQSPVHTYFDALLKVPAFMNAGGILGIPCAHAYPHAAGQEQHDLPANLKGIDMALSGALKALNLQVRLRPILNIKKENIFPELEQRDSDEDIQANIQSYLVDHGSVVGHSLHDFSASGDEGIDTLREILGTSWPFDLEEVIWVTSPVQNRQAALTYMAYGNQAELACRYSSLAFLVTIPPFSYRQTLDQPFALENLENFFESEDQ